jgi:hypothetical protein
MHSLLYEAEKRMRWVTKIRELRVWLNGVVRRLTRNQVNNLDEACVSITTKAAIYCVFATMSPFSFALSLGRHVDAMAAKEIRHFSHFTMEHSSNNE